MKLKDYLINIIEDTTIELTKTGFSGTLDGKVLQKLSVEELIGILKRVPGVQQAIEAAGGIEVLKGSKNPPMDITISAKGISIIPDAGGKPVEAKLNPDDYSSLQKLLAPYALGVGQTGSPLTTRPTEVVK